MEVTFHVMDQVMGIDWSINIIPSDKIGLGLKVNASLLYHLSMFHSLFKK